MFDKLTHEWLVSKGFHYHKSTKIDIYSKDGCHYVYDEGEEFGLRIQNLIRQKPVKLVFDMVELHRLISGVTIEI